MLQPNPIQLRHLNSANAQTWVLIDTVLDLSPKISDCEHLMRFYVFWGWIYTHPGKIITLSVEKGRTNEPPTIGHDPLLPRRPRILIFTRGEVYTIKCAVTRQEHDPAPFVGQLWNVAEAYQFDSNSNRPLVLLLASLECVEDPAELRLCPKGVWCPSSLPGRSYLPRDYSMIT